MALTTEQSKKVDRNRKDPTPTYYSADAKKDVPISSDFEAYLILLSDSLKEEIVSQFKAVKKDGSTRKDRDELLAMAMSSEIKDAQTKYDALNANLKSFTDFRNKLETNEFSAVVEIGIVLNDLQITFGEDLLSLDRMQHLVTFTTLAQTAFNEGKVSEDILKEIDSFTTLVNSYKGSK